MTDTNGDSLGTIKYYPYGSTRSGSVPTDKKFTGQRLDDTGLYYYNARYYDAGIGRFISPDTIVPSPANPQAYNRYSYVLNNPLRYIDPSGHVVTINGIDITDIDYLLLNTELLMMVAGSDILSDTIASERYKAYSILRTVTPNLTSMIERSSRKFSINWKNMTNIGEFNELANGNGEINISSTYKGYDSRVLAAMQGHELFHGAVCIAGIDSKNYSNEGFAYSLEANIAIKLGVESKMYDIHQHIMMFHVINPFDEWSVLDANMELAGQFLYGMGYKRNNVFAYKTWPGIFASKANDMIGLAQSVWVKMDE
jgi:RHS repeat-associated protein